jgi:hypothetical protein
MSLRSIFRPKAPPPTISERSHTATFLRDHDIGLKQIKSAQIVDAHTATVEKTTGQSVTIDVSWIVPMSRPTPAAAFCACVQEIIERNNAESVPKRPARQKAWPMAVLGR